MTQKEEMFIELSKKYEDLVNQLNVTRTNLENAMLNLGLGTFVQDPETKLVYQIVKPKGTFTYYRDIDYVRTKLPHEETATLSVKKAKEAGFIL